MIPYLGKRLAGGVVVMLLITLLAFVLYFVMPPISPAALFVGKEASPALLAAAKKELGLNHPVWVQYGIFLKRLILGDRYGWPGLGFSYTNRESVLSLIAPRLVITLTLAIGAGILWLALGVSVGTVAAVRPRRVIDRLALALSVFVLSAPVFWLGLMALWLFWDKLGIAAGTGYYSPAQYGLLTWLAHMVLPWTVLASLYAAWYFRMTRGAVLETLKADFVMTARGKGLREGRILVRHVLRASLTPMLTMVGMDLAGLVSGTIVVEQVFNLQGVGQLAINSVQSDDIPVVLGITLLGALLVVVGNIVIDVLYVWVDPRVRLGRR